MYLQTTHGSCKSRQSIGECSIFHRQNFRRNGLDDGNGRQSGADEDAASDQHAHGGGLGADDTSNTGNERRNGSEQLSIQYIR